MLQRLNWLGLLSLMLSVGACGESQDDNHVLAPEAVQPQFSLQGGGSAQISGPATISQFGDYHYSVCLSGLSGGTTYIVEVFTSYHGFVGDWSAANGVCASGESVYVDHTTPDFTVWARVYTNLLSYLGNSDTLSVNVNVPVPPINVTIFGDDEIAPNEQCGWQASASGGTTPYAYDWWGGLTGSSMNLFGSLPQSSYLWVAVTDATGQADTAQILVEVDEDFECDW